MPRWLSELVAALVQLIKELKGPMALWGAYQGGRGHERAVSARSDAETLERALAAPDASRMSDDEVRKDLERRDLYRLSGVQTHNGK